MDAYFFHEQVDALKAVVDRIAEHDLAAFGGSETVKQIGLVNYLTQHHANLFNRYAENISYEEKKEIERKSLLSDIFITGSNALTTSGELINIDHTGNRVSAILFGPKKVFIILGTNKIVDSLEEGIRRARTVAAPLNAKKLAEQANATQAGSLHSFSIRPLKESTPIKKSPLKNSPILAEVNYLRCSKPKTD